MGTLNFCLCCFLETHNREPQKRGICFCLTRTPSFVRLSTLYAFNLGSDPPNPLEVHAISFILVLINKTDNYICLRSSIALDTS